MATKVINTILNLRDNMSGGLVKAARNTKGVSKEMQSATRSVVAFKNKAVSSLASAAKSFTAWGAASAGAVTAAFLAMDNATEEYRIAQGRLITAFESAGYGAETASAAYNEFYKILGDTGSATEASQLLSKLIRNEQDVAQWTRVAAGVSGTFGDALPIQSLIEAANETAKVGTVTGVLADALNWVGISEDQMNAKLAAASDEAGRNQILLEALTGAYSGAADAFYANNQPLVQARQNEAALAAVTGNLGSASAAAKGGLMQLFGVQQDGSVRAGSALAWLNDKADSLVGLFQRWSQDGTMDRLTQMLDQSLAKGADLAGQAFQWLSAHGGTLLACLKPLAVTIAAFKLVKLGLDVANAANNFALFAKTVTAVSKANLLSSASWVKSTAAMVANKAAMAASTVASSAAAAGTGILTAAQLALNAAFVATPIGWIVLGVMALVAAGIALYKNWDTVKAKAGELWERVKETFGGIKEGIIGAFEGAKEKVLGFFSWIDEKIRGIPIIGTLYESAMNLGGWVADKISGHATGTSYFAGGWTRVNERGGEILRLPGGTQIIPHDVSKRMVGGPSIAVHVTVQGNVIGNQAYAEELGGAIAARILRALRNT